MRKITLATLIGLVLTGCGGGDENTPPPSPTATPPTVVRGTIQEVQGNDIIINGRRYDVSRVDYNKKELSNDMSLLKPQMMVQVTKQSKLGSIVNLDPTFLGMITNINPKTGTFTINGVNLSFGGLSNEISNGEWVMVSALPMATNNGVGYKVLSVIEIENTELEGQYELEGAVSQLDNEPSTFKLGQVIVDYSNINLSAGIKNGDWVEVTGQYQNLKFMANEVELESYDDLDNDHEIEGIITKVNSTQTEFELNARGTFIVNSQTRFEDGNQDNLVVGKLVEVTTINGIAKEIEFEHDFDDENGSLREFEREGRVTAVYYDSFVIGTETFYLDAR